jgi:tetratricopeptide (TPR) repeat protein
MSDGALHGDLSTRLLSDVLGEIHRGRLQGLLLVEDSAADLALQVGDGRAACAAGDTLEQIRRTAAAGNGRFRLEDGGPPEGGSPLTLLILAAARAVPDVARIRESLGSLERPLVGSGAEPPANGLEAREGFLLSRVDGVSTVRQVCQLSPDDEDETLRSVHGLIAAGLLRLGSGEVAPQADPMAKLQGFLQRTDEPDAEPAAPAATPAPPPARPRKPARNARRAVETVTVVRTRTRRDSPLRARIEDRLRTSEGQNHYDLLGLQHNASSEEIRETYYALARQLHPDRFHGPDVQDLQPAVEVLFGRMNDAYDVLQNAEARAEYDQRLNKKPADHRKVQEAAVKEVGRENYKHGRALLAKKQFVKALSFLENAAKADASNPEYLEALGAVQSLNPRFRTEAEQNLQAAIKAVPTRPEPYILLGLFYVKSRRNQEATAMFRQARSWDPDNRRAGLGESLLGKKADAPELAATMIRELLKNPQE